MDWEAANLSGPRQDLAWWVFFDDFNSEARGVPRLDGLGTREETLAFWADRVGEPVGDLQWYEVFTGFQITLFTLRTMSLLGGSTDLDSNQGFQMTRGCWVGESDRGRAGAARCTGSRRSSIPAPRTR